MKALMVMFDSLNRRFLPPYGCDWVKAPNFARLAERSVTFTNAFVGSMACIPARREMHTGRYNFLHRSWGPLEPFDDSMPELLKRHGVYTHLASDHMHYWEEGGATYHQRYNSWEVSRGQEGDPWKGVVKEPEMPKHLGQLWRNEVINRGYFARGRERPQVATFRKGMEFLRANAGADNWFLHMETFDPHEPFFAAEEFRKLYPHDYTGPHFDWPSYGPVTETPEQVRHLRFEYAALVSMCDHHLGKVLDLMDELDLWKDTMLIVNTDHGFLLGEHGFWAKSIVPFYNEVAHMPLFIWDPRSGRRGATCDSLVQTIDLAPTLLEYFGAGRPADMQGVPLRDAAASGAPVREAGLFGIHGGHVNVTDGRHVYMRAPAGPGEGPLFNYTLMPTHMHSHFSVEELKTAELGEAFSFTKGCRPLKVRAGKRWGTLPLETMLFDLKQDPGQERPLRDAGVERAMEGHLVRLMRENDAPPEQFERLGLS